MAPTTQSETSTVAIGEGSDAGKVDSEILNCKNDKDLAGSTFGKLCVKVKKSKKKAISLTWKKIQVAKTYVIYGAKWELHIRRLQLFTVRHLLIRS